MKTVEEIKESLNACSCHDYRCNECAYRTREDCSWGLSADALKYIEYLEEENAKLKDWRTAKEARHDDGSFKCIAHCPMCGEKVGNFGKVKQSYCWNCGQAIKFGGNDDATDTSY